MLIRIIGVFTAGLCGYACYWAVRWAVADYAARYPSGSRSSMRCGWRPEIRNITFVWRSRTGSGALSDATGRDLNPMGSSVWIEFAHAAEEHKDFPGAEHSLLRAVQLDQTFAPRWLLAEYYSRRKDQARFWPAARAALATSYDDVTPLFDLCWNFAAEPRTILDRAVPQPPRRIAAVFRFSPYQEPIGCREAHRQPGNEGCRPGTVPSLLSYCDRLLEKNDSARAVEVWNALATKRLLKYPVLAVAQGRSLTNGAFEKPLANGFDWRVSPVDGVFVRYGGVSIGLRFDFSGKQPESCELLAEFVPVEPLQPYQFVVRYATEGLDGDTGIKWRVMDVGTGVDLLRGGGHVIASEHKEKVERYKFFAPAETRLVKIVLAYNGARHSRIEGSLSLGNVALGFGP